MAVVYSAKLAWLDMINGDASMTKHSRLNSRKGSLLWGAHHRQTPALPAGAVEGYHAFRKLAPAAIIAFHPAAVQGTC